MSTRRALFAFVLAAIVASGCSSSQSDGESGGPGGAPAVSACNAPKAAGAVCGGLCGNGAIDTCDANSEAPVRLVEVCDGAALGGLSCASLGYLGGELRCSAYCTREVRGCVAADERFTTKVLFSDEAGVTTAQVAVHGVATAVAWARRDDNRVHVAALVNGQHADLGGRPARRSRRCRDPALAGT